MDADVVLRLGSPRGGAPSLAEIAEQIPPPSSLAPGRLLLVLGELEPSGAVLGRWLRARAHAVPRSTRSSALLAAGYANLGGGVDPKSGHDLAWGYAP